ncbi:ribosome small subunit-dependent GTPase A [Gracilibacillus sp. Marseille-QA3620]
MNINQLGWNSFFEEAFKLHDNYSALIPGRIISEHKGMYRILCEEREVLASISGKLRYQAHNSAGLPATGDWVALKMRHGENKAIIHAVLPRKSKFSRKKAGLTTEEQIIACNIDTVFLVNAVNADFNIRRLERYLLLAWDSGANPVILLSKSDLCSNIDDYIHQVENIAAGVPVHGVSAEQRLGLEALTPYIQEGKTIALLGSSGAGKSTLANVLYGEDRQQVHTTRDDDKGRHTTTHRELILLKKGGMIIDTPGMRELQLWEGEEGIHTSFNDIEELALNCKFNDCRHETEPGCQIQAAIQDGTLDKKRFKSYQKLQRELAYLAKKQRKHQKRR